MNPLIGAATCWVVQRLENGIHNYRSIRRSEDAASQESINTNMSQSDQSNV